MKSVEERFLKYISYPTMSDEDSTACPSTEKQRTLALAIKDELVEMGLSGVRLDENGYLYAYIPETAEGFDSIGFIAHLDTSSAMPDGPITPRVLKYEGGDITLNEEKNIVMRAEGFPALKKLKGDRLIVTDGTTLLGGDDKAGIAEIVCAAKRLIDEKPDHGRIAIAFTPDEEIGRGADLFDVKGFGAEYAYTVDGGELGELEYENFNAASAVVLVKGFSIHPGYAKGKMKNAAAIAAEFNTLLNPETLPEKTEGYEGFYHLISISGECEQARLDYILRDHDSAKLEELKEEFFAVASRINEKYGSGTVELNITDAYRNMKEIINSNPRTVSLAKEAMERLGITPMIQPIRGGTDGATLSFMGLPCPNIGTGSGNCHSGFEYVSIDQMEKTVELIIEIAKNAKKA